MLLAKHNTIITTERLTASRWSWGELHKPPLSTELQFGANGLIKNYSHENEFGWFVEDGILRIFSAAGALTWQFDIMFESNGQLTLISTYQNDIHWRPFFSLIEQETLQPSIAPAAAEPVRLVIWDLDDTFWQGTLSEGPITPVIEHINIIRTLNERGIMNSICSKNNVEPVKTVLQNLALWDEFIFPEIAFAPKGEAVARIIENAQLRPESVMFIDDNVTNLNEAIFYTPSLQIAAPDIIAYLLDDPRFKGKPDAKKTRLAHYKVLEQKSHEKAATQGDNTKFLRESQIRVSFHNDIEAEFPRIHDLVNRTNQLNFTKNRWPEDAKAALAVYHHEQARHFSSYGGYVKVADKYGEYGICGFYFVIQDACEHFLFSCRSMNMGVEQFVWNRLKRPHIEIKGEVISNLDMDVDWITVVADADIAAPESSPEKPRAICIRGACDMSMTSNFLRTRATTIEELTFAWEGWEICSLPRIIALHDELQNPANQSIISRLPGMPPNRFSSAIITGEADAYVLSFSQESFHGLYKSRSTGMILPMGHFSLFHMAEPKADYTRLAYGDIASNIIGISEAQWEFFRSEFDFIGGFNDALFLSDLSHVFTRLQDHGKPVIIIGLNDSVGTDHRILGFFANINRHVKPLARQFNFDYIDVNAFIKTEDDLAPDGMRGGAHFARNIYAKIAETILDRLDAKTTMPELALIR